MVLGVIGMKMVKLLGETRKKWVKGYGNGFILKMESLLKP